MAADDTPRKSWREAVAAYLHARVIGMLFLGFSAGLPFLLVFTTFQFWLAESGYDPKTIAFVTWIGIAYSIKVFWAPVVDRLRLPYLTRRLGRRRSWLLVAMIGIAVGLAGMAATDPKVDLGTMALFALLVAFSSATQDIALDAYRIEAVDRDLQGAMAATYQLGYRLAVLMAGAGALYIAEYASWFAAYATMASLTAVGIVTVLIVREPDVVRDTEAYKREARVVAFLEKSHAMPALLRGAIAWFIGAVVCPFLDFFARKGSVAIVILIFITLFRVSDITLGSMATKFYFDVGFTKTEVANVTKIFGFFMTIAGAFTGGTLVARFGIMRPMLAAGILISVGSLSFALLALAGHDLGLLTFVISLDNFAGGIAGSVFIAYLSSLTSAQYTATQYALFSSLMTLTGKIIGGFSGVVAENLGLVVQGGKVLNVEAYANFFVYSAAVGIPAILLILYLMRVASADKRTEPAPAAAKSAAE
ncbi:MAG TPA: MFS transporter [Alphaproteobacteria bacterium]|jgi:PAT family beta-lactamase induction signal transducer AmpG|nr:MFS transporter [Alphaproteobacteria bacterium]